MESPVTIKEEYLLHQHYDAQLDEQSRRGRQWNYVRLCEAVYVDVKSTEEVLDGYSISLIMSVPKIVTDWNWQLIL